MFKIYKKNKPTISLVGLFVNFSFYVRTSLHIPLLPFLRF